jgi:hypothetical protein
MFSKMEHPNITILGYVKGVGFFRKKGYPTEGIRIGILE